MSVGFSICSMFRLIGSKFAIIEESILNILQLQSRCKLRCSNMIGKLVMFIDENDIKFRKDYWCLPTACEVAASKLLIFKTLLESLQTATTTKNLFPPTPCPPMKRYIMILFGYFLCHLIRLLQVEIRLERAPSKTSTDNSCLREVLPVIIIRFPGTLPPLRL